MQNALTLKKTRNMSDLFKLLINGSPENQASYERLRKYWRLNTPKLLKMGNKNNEKDGKRLLETERRGHYQMYYMDFIATYYHDIEIICADIEHVAKRLLGCWLRVQNSVPLKITMLEVYADGIWDESGDFLKGLFQYECNSIRKKNIDFPLISSEIEKGNSKFLCKLLEGPRLYFYGGRLDIKIFGKFLPFSFLIRQFRNDKNELVDFNGRHDKIISQLQKRKFDEATLKDFGSAGIHFETLEPEEITQLNKLAISSSAYIRSSYGPVIITDREKDIPEDKIKYRYRIEGNRETGLNGLYKYRPWNISLDLDS